MLYSNMDPCPADKTNRSRSNHWECLGFTFICLVHKAYAIGAAPMGSPGCPELAFCTPSILNIRTVSTASWSILSNILFSPIKLIFNVVHKIDRLFFVYILAGVLIQYFRNADG